jgi:hypothetical protein
MRLPVASTRRFASRASSTRTTSDAVPSVDNSRASSGTVGSPSRSTAESTATCLSVSLLVDTVGHYLLESRTSLPSEPLDGVDG